MELQAMSMNHNFWIFQEGERAYTDYWDLLPRRDAPAVLHDDMIGYLNDTLMWIPSLNPAVENKRGNGLHRFGPTIINQEGGNLFHRIFATWAHMFRNGPQFLRLRGDFSFEWPYEESEHLFSEHDFFKKRGGYLQIDVGRDYLVRQLTTLSQFGAQAATGRYFIIHLGI